MGCTVFCVGKPDEGLWIDRVYILGMYVGRYKIKTFVMINMCNQIQLSFPSNLFSAKKRGGVRNIEMVDFTNKEAAVNLKEAAVNLNSKRYNFVFNWKTQ